MCFLKRNSCFNDRLIIAVVIAIGMTRCDNNADPNDAGSEITDGVKFVHDAALDLFIADGAPTDDTVIAKPDGNTAPESSIFPLPTACELQTFYPATTSCSTSTATCLQKSQSSAEIEDCLSNDPNCKTCIDDAYAYCVLGDKNTPGRCASAFACYWQCLIDECGETSPESCYTQAKAGPCSTVLATYTSCSDMAAPENKLCWDSMFSTCKLVGTCGNGIIEAGETCDGNCPTLASCDPSVNPDYLWTYSGNAATCTAKCEKTLITPSESCPLNATPSSQLGFPLFSGSFFDRPNWFDYLNGKYFHGSDAVYGWRAPKNGTYTFMLYSLGSFASFGDKIDYSSSQGSLAVLEGTQCKTATKVLGTSGLKSSVPIKLSSGQDVLIVASRFLDTDSSDGVYDLKAPYEIGVEQCVPQCTGLMCGDDGCGGTCTCASGYQCKQGYCKCVPQCSGKTCGDDGCGGTCGNCGIGETCSNGTCSCTPSCTGKVCGSDGCGGSCGSCSSGKTCTTSGQCATCTPSCTGKICGSDGCGGSCGNCKSGETCTSWGTCQTASCSPLTQFPCSFPEECILLSNETTQCAVLGNGTHGDSCSTSADCRGGYACFSGACHTICTLSTGAECDGDSICNGVSGWKKYGACTL